MLDLDLDLEAELGIDTVKQVAALAAVRERLNLPQDPQFRMQDARTLRQAIDYLNRRIRSVSGAPESGRPPSVANRSVTSESVESGNGSGVPGVTTVTPKCFPAPLPANPSMQELASALNELGQYVQSLSLLVTQLLQDSSTTPPPAAPTIPTSATQSGAVSKSPPVTPAMYPALLLEAIIPKAGCPAQGELLELAGIAIAASDSSLPLTGSSGADGIPIHARTSEGQIVATSRRSRLDGVSLAAPQSMVDAVRNGRSVADSHILQDYLERCGRAKSSSIAWAHSQGFTVTVGGARVPGSCSGENALLNLLANCYDVASFAWFSLTGALHCLSTIERVCFYQVPAPNDELLLCSRMTHPTGGFWRADVAVFNASGRLFAEISGIEGIPQMQSGIFRCAGSDPAERAWRRFAERMERDSVSPKDIAS
jgi:hypothetical protein